MNLPAAATASANTACTPDDGSRLAPRPGTVDDTGLGERLLGELLVRHLHAGGTQNVAALAARTSLCGPVLHELLTGLRRDGRVQVNAVRGGDGALNYALTERGRVSALDSLQRDGYTGPAPVPLEAWTRIVRAQSVRHLRVTRERVHFAFADTVVDPDTLDRLGPAVGSGRALFVHGPPGTGKTYLTQRLSRLFDDTVLVPHAIAVDECIVQVLDPALHHITAPNAPDPMLNRGHDPRYVRCRRPVVITGGELSADMLEVHHDPVQRLHRAPLHLMASNGLLILDDLGRQRVAPQQVLNRWIGPMEEGHDHLLLANGAHFTVPFDLVLVFSTNLAPAELADDAFLRRIGHKIGFGPLSEPAYEAIWDRTCAELGVADDDALCRHAIDALHTAHGVPLLPCHPRDLIAMVADRARYLDEAPRLTREALRTAWDSYFVQ